MRLRIEDSFVRKFVIVLIAALLAACGNGGSTGASGGTVIAVSNGDFEKAADGDDVVDWTFVQHAGVPSYKVGLDHQDPGQGKTSFRMERTHAQIYGSIMQRLDFKSYAGKKVRLTALTKTENVGPDGWKLYINTNAPNGLAYSKGQTGTSGWQTQTLDFAVPQPVGEVTIGATLLDAGTAWLDDVHLQVVD
jgi:hypothetical protein